jgi:hypothetical protein
MNELERLDRLADLLDTRFRIPGLGLRFGVDGVVGLLPGVGDTLSLLVSLYMIRECRKLGVPLPVTLRMLGNVGLDWAVGSIPVVGSVFDFVFKANRRNLVLAREALERRRTGARTARRTATMVLSPAHAG